MEIYEANRIFEFNDEFINFDSNYLLITSKGMEEIGEKYAKKFSEKLNLYNQDKLSDRTYIGLNYPPTGESDNTFRLFFESIKCGLTRNVFSGTFFISLSMYKNFDEFIENGYSKDFYNLIDQNRKNVVFIIQVYSDFKDKEKLFDWLNSCKNIFALDEVFEMPKEFWLESVLERLSHEEIIISSSEKVAISVVLEKLIESENFENYKSVNNFVNKIIFFKKMKGKLLTEENICKFLPKEKVDERKIGF